MSSGARRCAKCTVIKPLTEFYKTKTERAKIRYASYCKNCWASKQAQFGKERQRRRRLMLKREVLEAYGGKCACCAVTDLVFLAVDHVVGGGTKHRKSLGDSPMALYAWLKGQHFPGGFQILCHNCNWAKYVLGRCPHQSVPA